jgi:hypothetical protein
MVWMEIKMLNAYAITSLIYVHDFFSMHTTTLNFLLLFFLLLLLLYHHHQGLILYFMLTRIILTQAMLGGKLCSSQINTSACDHIWR